MWSEYWILFCNVRNWRGSWVWRLSSSNQSNCCHSCAMQAWKQQCTVVVCCKGGDCKGRRMRWATVWGGTSRLWTRRKSNQFPSHTGGKSCGTGGVHWTRVFIGLSTADKHYQKITSVPAQFKNYGALTYGSLTHLVSTTAQIIVQIGFNGYRRTRTFRNINNLKIQCTLATGCQINGTAKDHNHALKCRRENVFIFVLSGRGAASIPPPILDAFKIRNDSVTGDFTTPSSTLPNHWVWARGMPWLHTQWHQGIRLSLPLG